MKQNEFIKHIISGFAILFFARLTSPFIGGLTYYNGYEVDIY